jgi:hypothetical protein
VLATDRRRPHPLRRRSWTQGLRRCRTCHPRQRQETRRPASHR